MDFETVIGLEVHAQLSTESKIFCGCSTAFGAAPNTQVCPVCLGLPGVLPVLNKKAVELAVRAALVLHGEVRERSIFARKNYFYPDLPKGYQISQYEEPLAERGFLEIDSSPGEKKKIRIHRIHLEEDAGKLVHDEIYVNENESLVDYNRCGIPLIEIVSEPDLRSPKEVFRYLSKLRQILRWIDVCDGNMEEGRLRCDANISLRPSGSKGLGVKTELKNMNSIHGVEKALEAEVERQMNMLKGGRAVVQQTLLWDEVQKTVVPMRSKEEAHDYRYFPEPDLSPLVVEKSWLNAIRTTIPEMPDQIKTRWIQNYRLTEYDSNVLSENRETAEYFEKTVQLSGDPKQASNWVMGEVLRTLNEKKYPIRDLPVKPSHLAEIIRLMDRGTLSKTLAKKVFEETLAGKGSPSQIVETLGLTQVSDSGLIEEVIDRIIRENQGEVQKYLSGKDKVFGFMVGQVMKVTQGKANPKMVNEVLANQLRKMKEKG